MGYTENFHLPFPYSVYAGSSREKDVASSFEGGPNVSDACTMYWHQGSIRETARVRKGALARRRRRPDNRFCCCRAHTSIVFLTDGEKNRLCLSASIARTEDDDDIR